MELKEEQVKRLKERKERKKTVGKRNHTTEFTEIQLIEMNEKERLNYSVQGSILR